MREITIAAPFPLQLFCYIITLIVVVALSLLLGGLLALLVAYNKALGMINNPIFHSKRIEIISLEKSCQALRTNAPVENCG